MDNQTPFGQSSGVSGNKGMAIFSYLGIFIIVPFLTGAKSDPFVNFHLKQGLGLIVAAIVWSIVSAVLGFILGSIGLGFIAMLFPLVHFGLLIIDIIGILNVISGKMNPLPLVGGVGNMFNF